MSDIDFYKGLVEKNFVIPLNEFRSMANMLDHTHNDHLHTFEKTIWQLFSRDVTFTGPAANALATAVGDYIQAASSLTNASTLPIDTNNDLSSLLENTAKICERAASSTKDQLMALPDADPTQAAQGVFGAVIVNGQKIPEFWQAVLVTGLAAAATTYIVVNGQQQSIMDSISCIEEQWESDILNQGYAALAEPKLPP